MAVLHTTRPAPAISLRAGLLNVFARLSAWNDARLTRKALSRLTDRELDDIGLTRGDITRMTF